MEDDVNKMLDSLEESDQPKSKPAKKSTVKKAKPLTKREQMEIDARKRKEHKFAPGQMVNIIVQKDKEKGGDRPIPVGYNGTCYTVPRGVAVKVPAPVAEILMNAEETIVEWDEKNDEIITRNAAAYPTSVRL